MPSPAAEGPSLYVAREPVFPKAVKGFFRRLKWWLMALTLGIYYITPWIRWDRGAHLPDQAVLVDLASRRFFFFWIEIWPQEFYYVAGLLIMAGLGLFLFTSVLGRVWCGYACPQTVWVDLYQHVERWIDGDRNAQFRLLKQRWNAQKIARRLAKWSIWLLIAVATGGAWVFYFADAPTLFVDLVTANAPFVAYATVGVLTGTTFVLGGFMREQVCIYMCPWPRIQGAMLDENSLIVTYKDWRGEPRGKHRKKTTGLGDCIDCNACVAVCPTGVDIREGQQIGCITCALCIDACDEIMDRIGRPRGLIDYCTLGDEALERGGAAPVPLLKRIIRPRTILYTAMWSLIGVAMVVALFMRDSIGLTVAHDRNPLYVELSDGSIRNAYTVKVENMNANPHQFRLSAKSDPELRLDIQDMDVNTFEIGADEARKLRVFLLARPWFEMPERTPVRLWVEDLVTRERTYYDTHFQGPEK
ncbi:MAG TPA: cytochrome c oxidase accessory protein CcoG [Thermohalobaculum sp.]|nr:cytochrome c oxidase accessory protein CcoG [Thermohalobaculum sp.]